MKNLAVVPIRAGSKRLPNKNVRDFFGKPIFLYTLEHARRSGLFDTILVSTESKEIADLCEELGFPVPFLRPPELASDQAQLVQVLNHVLQTFSNRGVEFDHFCMLWATAPMRTAEDVRNAYDMLTAEEEVEAVIGVTDYYFPPLCALREDEYGFLRAMFPEYMSLPSAEHPRSLIDNGSMCWVKVAAFREHGSWLPPRLRGYRMPRNRSVDVDEQQDWDLLEYYYRKQGEGMKPSSHD